MMSDDTELTLFIMNDDVTLYIAALYVHTNNSSGSGISLFFDQGDSAGIPGGAHDDTLTIGTNGRGEAGYSY